MMIESEFKQWIAENNYKLWVVLNNVCYWTLNNGRYLETTQDIYNDYKSEA